MPLFPPAVSRGTAAGVDAPPSHPNTPAFDAVQFDDLIDMIGDDGVMEMVTIFDAETRQRLRRVTEGGLDLPTMVREMHTLKGAAGTVAAPALTALGRALELAARRGVAPTRADIAMIEASLDAWLTEVRVWCAHHEPVD
jgi:HPt (histidine-containing phosphotransfer) domain-containing protein